MEHLGILFILLVVNVVLFSEATRNVQVNENALCAGWTCNAQELGSGTGKGTRKFKMLCEKVFRRRRPERTHTKYATTCLSANPHPLGNVYNNHQQTYYEELLDVVCPNVQAKYGVVAEEKINTYREIRIRGNEDTLRTFTQKQLDDKRKDGTYGQGPRRSKIGRGYEAVEYVLIPNTGELGSIKDNYGLDWKLLKKIDCD